MPVRRAISRAFRPIRRRFGTAQLCQAARPDSTHARPASRSRYAGMLAPSQSRVAPIASRRRDGVVMITYAAATPADTRTALATVRAIGSRTASAPVGAATRVRAAAARPAVSARRRSVARSRRSGAAARSGPGRRAGGFARVALRFVGSAGYGIARLVDHAAALLRPVAGGFARTTIAF